MSGSDKKSILQDLSQSGKIIRKSLGQHYLVNPGVVKKITDACLRHSKENQKVVEIGPGLGALTESLLEAGCDVTAVEIEAESSAILQEKFSASFSGRFEVLNRDFMELKAEELWEKVFPGKSFSTHPETYLLAGNLPYNLTSEILFRSLEEHLPRLHAMVYMMQKEVAVRLRNPPGTREYGVLSVLLQPFFEISLVCPVAPGSFYPPPKVDSEVLLFKKKKVLPVFKNPPLFKSLVRSAFNQRRKQIRVALRNSSLFPFDTVKLNALWDQHPSFAEKRAEALSWEDFRMLAESYEDQASL